jgi:antitoxin YefM
MKSISLSDAKARLSELLNEVDDFETYYITRNGKVAGVVVHPDEWAAMRETLEILADENLMKQIKESRRSKKIYSFDEVFKDLR